MLFVVLYCPVTALNNESGVQSGDTEKDKLRASLGSAILAERPNVKVSLQAATADMRDMIGTGQYLMATLPVVMQCFLAAPCMLL